jgi:hypothetical protein
MITIGSNVFAGHVFKEIFFWLGFAYPVEISGASGATAHSNLKILRYLASHINVVHYTARQPVSFVPLLIKTGLDFLW